MSTTLDQAAEISRLRNVNTNLRDALRMARERVRNVDRDIVCNLLNRDHLWDIIEEIDNALNQRETQNA